MNMVFIQTPRVHIYGDGIVGIEVEGRDISAEERDLLHRLYPNLVDRAFQLLDQESLLGSMVRDVTPLSTTHDIIETTKKVKPCKSSSLP